MIRFALVATVALLLGATNAGAQALEATCDIVFSGSSGLGPWTGRVPTLRIRPVPSPSPGRWNALIEIPIKSLEDGNKPRDAQLHAMFESREWPVLTAALRDVDPAEMQKSSRVAVELTIRDQKRKVEAKLDKWSAEGGRTQFEADVAVSLKDFALEAPSVLGLSRVNDDVKIHARVVVGTVAPKK